MATKELRALTNCLACLGFDLYRFRQCAFYGPAMFQATVQRLKADSNFGNPVSKAHCFVVKGDELIRATISGLLCFRCPATICGPAIFNALHAMTTRIAFRAIDSVNAMRWRRLWSHIGVEIFKRIPSRAYCFAAPSVARKGFHILVSAALLHPAPGIVFLRVAHAVLFAARFAATATVSRKFCSINRFFSSALAEAGPVCITSRWMFLCLCNHCPFAELLPSQVYKPRTATSRIAVSHDFVPVKQVVVRTARRLQSPGCSHFSSLVIRGQR